MCKVLVTEFVTILIFFSFPNVVLAHKASIAAWLQGHILHTESRFDSGRKIQNGTIEIIDSNGDIIITGETNKSGCFSAKIDKADDLKIVLVTPCGHRNFSTISKDEFHYFEIGKNTNTNPDFQTEIHYPTLEQIELIISRQLNSKLEPIKKNIAFGQKRNISFHDIVGGIGYIIGIVGLATYIKCKRA